MNTPLKSKISYDESIMPLERILKSHLIGLFENVMDLVLDYTLDTNFMLDPEARPITTSHTR